MPAGYIGYAGAIMTNDTELVWKKKPCPMMFFHGSADTTVAPEKRISPDNKNNVFGPKYILAQLHEMEVPNWFYCEIDADHVLSYKAFSGYNFPEIQTFVQKFVIQGLQLEMKTEEYNITEPSHLPGFQPVRSKNPQPERPAFGGMPQGGQRRQGAPQGAPQGPRPQGAPQGPRPQGAPQGPRPQGAPQQAR